MRLQHGIELLQQLGAQIGFVLFRLLTQTIGFRCRCTSLISLSSELLLLRDCRLTRSLRLLLLLQSRLTRSFSFRLRLLGLLCGLLSFLAHALGFRTILLRLLTTQRLGLCLSFSLRLAVCRFTRQTLFLLLLERHHARVFGRLRRIASECRDLRLLLRPISVLR